MAAGPRAGLWAGPRALVRVVVQPAHPRGVVQHVVAVDEVGMSHVVPGGAAPVTLWRVSNKGYTAWRPAIWELKLFADKVCVCTRARVCVRARRKAPSAAF